MYLIPLLIIAILFVEGFANNQDSLDGLSLNFMKDPGGKVDFLNTKGVEIECSVRGTPSPKIEWKTADGKPVTSISGLRNIESSGKILRFNTFAADKYRIDVHDTVYRCSASNSFGTVVSGDIVVNGVVSQNHDIQVYDTFAIEGNTAVFKCHVPSVLVDYVTVTAWIKNDNLLIQPNLDSSAEEKYALTPTGELHIRDISKSDSGSKYRCKTVHRLSGEGKDSSNTGQLIVTAPSGTISPRIVDSYSTVRVAQKQTAILSCVAQGNSLPKVNWFKKSASGQITRLQVGSRFIQTKSTLLVKDAQFSDAGIYICEAVNEMGKEQFEIKLIFIEPLTAVIKPSIQKVKLHERVVFKCEVSGIALESISWLFNASPLPNKGNELVIDDVTMSDRGMYQCRVSNEIESSQAVAQLQLSEVLPYFEETFKNATLQPGNSMSVKCIASGIPLPIIKWKLDESDVQNKSRFSIVTNLNNNGRIVSIFKMEKLAVQDGGFYSCVAINDAGTTKHSAKINVYGPLGKRQSQEYFGTSGQTMLLYCPIYGYPVSNLVWEKNKKKLPNNMRQTVLADGSLEVLSSNKLSDAGTYKCIAYDDDKSKIEAQIKLTIMVQPKLVPFEFQEELLREGMRARLQCVVSEGDLPLNVTWLKDGKPFSDNLGVTVRSLDEFSSILTISSINPRHNGKYTCVASNRAATVTHTAQLSVNVPPKIVPFEFQEEQLIEGMLARISCIVSRGDLPLQLQWDKNGKNLMDISDILIKSFDEHSSILTITKVSSQHNGVYTCLATNDAGTARHSSQLIVKVPPRWIIEPNTITSVIGQNVMFDCQAYGFPEPKIIWMHSKEIGRNAVIKPVLSLDNILLYSNGSLSIGHVTNNEQGYYYCKAENGIGNEISTVVELNLNTPPLFKNMISIIEKAVDKQAELQCLVQGDPPIKITWYKDEKIIQDKPLKNKIQTTSTASDAISTFSIYKTSKNDQGIYICSAENMYGSNKTSIKLIIRGLPSVPYNLQATSIESKTFELMWAIKNDESDPIIKFIIEYKEEHDSWDNSVSLETVNGIPTNNIISNLKPSTNYLFRIYSQNTLGKSAASQILKVSTLETAPSRPPVNIQVESVNTETFKVMWKAPEKQFWNGKLQGFYVGYKEVDTNDPYLFKTLLTPDPSANNLYVQIGGLKQFSKYAVVVLAYNSEGKGPESEPVIVMTSEGAPSLPPTDVRCTILTALSIHVTWTAPSSDSINGILRGYKVVYKPVSDWFDDLPENFNVTLSTALTVYNMEKFTNYSIQVLAMTKAGDGPRSAAVYCKTLDDIPCPPSDIKALTTTEDSVIVSWKAPDCPNGILQSYSIYWKISGESKAALSQTVSFHDSYFEVTSLKKGKKYEFSVTASTIAGEGKPSKIITQIPSGPTVAAKVVSFDKKIVTSWKSDINLACQAVGLPEPQKKWTINGHIANQNSRAKISSEGSLTINGIEENEGGDYSCQVKNDIGEDKIVYTIIVLSPPSSPFIELTKITSNTIEIQWKVPTSKMSRIKGYTIHIQDIGEWKEVTVGSDSRNYALNNLECGTRYEIYMTAFNKIGFGQPSDLLVVSTNGSVPAAPSKSDLIEESSTSISLYLNTWKNNGCPILYYIVEYANKAVNDWTSVSNNVKPEQRRLVIRGLQPATWYSLRMTAHNSAGSAVAEYNFATLTETGATILPELMSDSTDNPMDGILPFLNFYIIVPIACTVIILLAIIGVAWFYVKIKSRDENGGCGAQQMGSFPPQMPTSTLRRGNSLESFAYTQQGTLKHGGGGIHADNDLAPYATFQLNQEPFNTVNRRSGVPLPLPNDRFSSENRNTQYFMQGTPRNMLFPTQTIQGMETTTFIFPNGPKDDDFPTRNINNPSN